MGAKHTPGPWQLTELQPGNDGEPEPLFRIEGESTLFLTVSPCSDGYIPGQNKANARLIAAAPALLAACKAMLQLWLAEHPDDECACLGASEDCPHPPPCEQCIAHAAIALAEPPTPPPATPVPGSLVYSDGDYFVIQPEAK